MSPVQAEDVARWTAKIQDSIADSSAVRDGLHDDEAIPLVDWGAEQAQHIAARLAAPELPPPDEERVGNTAYSLVRLMTRITWVVVYRAKKDAAWLTRTFHTINDLSRELHGPDAPVLSDDEIAAWIAESKDKSSGELVKNLTARLTPAAPASDVSSKPSLPAAPNSPVPPTLPGEDPHEPT